MVLKRKIQVGRNPLLDLCPFCGEPAEIYCREGESGCRVRCSNLACAFRPDSSVSFSSEELAVKTWNTRKGGCSGADLRALKDVIMRDYSGE